MQQPSALLYDGQCINDCEDNCPEVLLGPAKRDLRYRIKSWFIILMSTLLNWLMEQIKKMQSTNSVLVRNNTRQQPQTSGFINQACRFTCVVTVQTLENFGMISLLCAESVVCLLIVLWLLSFSVLLLLTGMRFDFEEFEGGQKWIAAIIVLSLALMAAIPFCIQSFYLPYIPH